ncbi:DUF2232 domain-containing protein [Flaviflagellibacter deserti]|uniref:DUF2232 domain-containing protein n=1 Tax=Flaviflagellibacter deserti TaxID=2267266 RepID=A0ABV9Z2C1_9HYPH
MMIVFLVGLASGIASATLSLALASGSTLSVLLFIFAPLPIFIASLGWQHQAGLIGVMIAASVLFGLGDFDTARAYVLSVGAPSWWLAYLALLGRSRDEGNPEAGMDWYPVGRLIIWAALLGAGLVLVTIPLVAGSLDEYRAAIRTTFETFLRVETGTPAGQPVTLPGGGDPTRITELAVLALPPLAAALWSTVSLVNLWVAGRVVRTSGRLARPWPNISEFQLPRFSLLIMLGATAASILPGIAGFTAGILSTSFAIPFAMLGLALIHAGTRGTTGRGLIIGAAYVLLAVQAWTVIILTFIGIAEHVFSIRDRIAISRASNPKS